MSSYENVSPDEKHHLVVLCKDRSDILNSRGTGGHWLVETVDAAARDVWVAISSIARSLPGTFDRVEEHAEHPEAVVAPSTSLPSAPVLSLQLLLGGLPFLPHHLFEDFLLCVSLATVRLVELDLRVWLGIEDGRVVHDVGILVLRNFWQSVVSFQDWQRFAEEIQRLVFDQLKGIGDAEDALPNGI